MKVTITRVKVDTQTKDGRPLISSKSGKPYFKVGIQTNEYGATWLNGLMPFNPDRWQNTTQELEVYDEEYQGKTYKKFKLPPHESKTVVDPRIFTELTAIRTELVMLRQLLERGATLPKENYPESNGPTAFDEGDINPADISFN